MTSVQRFLTGFVAFAGSGISGLDGLIGAEERVINSKGKMNSDVVSDSLPHLSAPKGPPPPHTAE